jgi:hypothetical protein
LKTFNKRNQGYPIQKEAAVVLLINRESLFRTIREEDCANVNAQALAQFQKQLVEDAYTVSEAGFGQLALKSIPIKKHTAYKVTSLSHLIVLRRINFILRYSIGLQQSDRDIIVRRLATILGEGVHHRIYKYDIKSFYESINTARLLTDISNDGRVPRHVSRLLHDYSARLSALGVAGLPRGIALSATLAEYAMQAFDNYVSRLPEVYFYSRYVDDIIIVTNARSTRATFGNHIRHKLPYGLDFNPTKTQFLDIAIQKKITGNPVIGTIDYLGYRFAVCQSSKSNGRLSRLVNLTISPKKIRRLKTRICCAVVQFMRDGNWAALQRRLQLLSGNYNVRDSASGHNRNVGLYCNYRRVNQISDLEDLDKFFRSVVIGNRGKIAKRFAVAATLQQRRSLLRFSFTSSFKRRIFYNFNANEVEALTRCWRHA